MTQTYYAAVAYASDAIAFLALIGNGIVLGVNFVDVRRLPGFPYYVRVSVSQAAVGLMCVANVAVGPFAVTWFTIIGIAGGLHLRDPHPVCLILSGVFVWTSVVYLMGLVTMALDRLLAVRQLRLSGTDGGMDRIHMTSRDAMLGFVGFSLYATTVCVVLTASGAQGVPMTTYCTVHTDSRCAIVAVW